MLGIWLKEDLRPARHVRRGHNVLKGLVSRGIPIERFQVVAKGGTDPAVPTPPGVGEERNRSVELTWR
jgi:outer membrane protein OmpA-like peptidoglycan-associated protein